MPSLSTNTLNASFMQDVTLKKKKKTRETKKSIDISALKNVL